MTRCMKIHGDINWNKYRNVQDCISVDFIVDQDHYTVEYLSRTAY